MHHSAFSIVFAVAILCGSVLADTHAARFSSHHARMRQVRRAEEAKGIVRPKHGPHRRCPRKSTSSLAPTSTTSRSHHHTTSSPPPAHTTKHAHAPPKPPKSPPKPPQHHDGNIPGAPVKDVYWPSQTNDGPVPLQTNAFHGDPLLKDLSYAANNDDNELFQQTHTGDLTYYGQSTVACGDTYTDDTYTAAISHELWDAWPGATSQTNTNPACGPYVGGRAVIGMDGKFHTMVKSDVGTMLIGGDGLPACWGAVFATPGRCHIPMTATITNPNNGKSVVVQIADKCMGCAGKGDIDVTITAFKEIADPSLGRVAGIMWKFNPY